MQQYRKKLGTTEAIHWDGTKEGVKYVTDFFIKIGLSVDSIIFREGASYMYITITEKICYHIPREGWVIKEEGKIRIMNGAEFTDAYEPVSAPSVPQSEGGLQWVKGRYDELYRQVKSGIDTPCLVDFRWDKDKILRDICRIKSNNLELGARGISYGSIWVEEGETEEQAFIRMCEDANVEWIPATSPSTANTEVQSVSLRSILFEWLREYTEWLPQNYIYNNTDQIWQFKTDGGKWIKCESGIPADDFVCLFPLPSWPVNTEGETEGKLPEMDEERVTANQFSGMPREEAVFQDGFSAGVDFGYNKASKEQQIAFAEWTQSNGWDFYPIGKFWNKRRGGDKSTTELYELFLTETKQQ